MARKRIIAANWKMHKTYVSALTLFEELLTVPSSPPVEWILLPPTLYIVPFIGLIDKAKSNWKIGAQHCHYALEGAFTGEISVPMLASVGASYVLLGHSERRTLFGETDDTVAKTLMHVLHTTLTPIVCCGESAEIRRKGGAVEYVLNQLEYIVESLSAEQASKIVIAYEPYWAIGTGVAAEPEEVQEMHWSIRRFLYKRFGESVSEQVPILYGGSCKPHNAHSLFLQPDIDGGLIGSASLSLTTFLPILNALDNAKK